MTSLRSTDSPPSEIASVSLMVGRLRRIAERLERYALRFERVGDSRCVFTRVYADMTRALAEALPHRPWDDTEWVVRLAEEFSHRYFAALDAFDAGRTPSAAWETLQSIMRQRRTSVLQDLIAGMVGHIVHDLPNALCAAGLAAAGASHVDDYHRVNDVLGDAIEPLRRDVEQRYDPWLKWFDWVGRTNQDLLTDYGIRLSRAAAWYNGDRLLDPHARAEALAGLETSPVAFVEQLFHPPLLAARALVRLVSVVISIGRRWPRPAVPASRGPVDAPNRRYYFGTGVGRWRGGFRFAVTDWPAFWHAPLGIRNRLLVGGMAAMMAIFRRARIDSTIDAFPEQGPYGVATNDVRISLCGVTLYWLLEQYALDADGASVFVRSYERFGPVSSLFNVEKRHPAKVTDEGRNATYWIPLLGADWVGEYVVGTDGNHLESVLTCPWARATESIERVAAADG